MEEGGSSVPPWARSAAGQVVKIGGSYFVEDGNHRVSVARYQGVETIEADVTEYFPV